MPYTVVQCVGSVVCMYCFCRVAIHVMCCWYWLLSPQVLQERKEQLQQQLRSATDNVQEVQQRLHSAQKEHQAACEAANQQLQVGVALRWSTLPANSLPGRWHCSSPLCTAPLNFTGHCKRTMAFVCATHGAQIPFHYPEDDDLKCNLSLESHFQDNGPNISQRTW